MWRAKTLMVVGLIAVFTMPIASLAHSDDELTNWQRGWLERVENNGAMSPTLLAEYLDWKRRHPCNEVLDTPCRPRPVVRSSSSTTSRSTTPSNTSMGSNVEQWRDLVNSYFGENTDKALRVMACESGGNPNAMNRSSRASGLFQFLPSTWKSTTGESYPGNVFDGPSNIAAAAKLSNGGSSWQQWSCKP